MKVISSQWPVVSKNVFRFALYALLLALCVSVEAQQPAKIPRIGYVSGTGDPKNPGPQVNAFRQGLRDLGYIEGKTIFVEYRYLEGKRDRIPSILVQLNVDVLLPEQPPAIRAAKQATKTISSDRAAHEVRASHQPKNSEARCCFARIR